MHYLLTGIVDPVGRRELTMERVPGALELSYVGRHNAVKGYDLLAEVGPQFHRYDAVIKVGGRMDH